MFYIGQKVVCISVESFDLYPRTKVPKLNSVYTIRNFDDSNSVRFFELVNEIGYCIDIDTDKESLAEPSFYLKNFKPLLKKQTDISILTALLNPTNHKQLENV